MNKHPCLIPKEHSFITQMPSALKRLLLFIPTHTSIGNRSHSELNRLNSHSHTIFTLLTFLLPIVSGVPLLKQICSIMASDGVKCDRDETSSSDEDSSTGDETDDNRVSTTRNRQKREIVSCQGFVSI